MSDFNPLDRARISTHRSSFDLSSKKLFTAKVGEILPCYWQIAIPGNKYRISSDWFTRTVPVNTAAYTRIKEYYDFYAVPLRLISRALPQAFTQMTDYMTSAASSDRNTTSLSSVPYTTMAQFNNLLLVANTDTIEVIDSSVNDRIDFLFNLRIRVIVFHEIAAFLKESDRRSRPGFKRVACAI
jgi:hypothetical protein